MKRLQIYAQKYPKKVWRPGTARTHRGSLRAPPDTLPQCGPTSKGDGKEEWEERWDEKRREFPPKSR